MTLSVLKLQKQDVERAKLLLLTEKSDDPFKESIVHKQSDHLVMMAAYRKWEKILREVCHSGFLP